MTSATGGATVSPDNAISTIIFAASDYPYGMFEFDSASEISITEVYTALSTYMYLSLSLEQLYCC